MDPVSMLSLATLGVAALSALVEGRRGQVDPWLVERLWEIFILEQPEGEVTEKQYVAWDEEMANGTPPLPLLPVDLGALDEESLEEISDGLRDGSSFVMFLTGQDLGWLLRMKRLYGVAAKIWERTFPIERPDGTTVHAWFIHPLEIQLALEEEGLGSLPNAPESLPLQQVVNMIGPMPSEIFVQLKVRDWIEEHDLSGYPSDPDGLRQVLDAEEDSIHELDLATGQHPNFGEILFVEIRDHLLHREK